MKSIIIYRRVSSRKQGESGLGLEAQMRDIDLYLKYYVKDYQVLDTFTDIASGKDSNRPALQKAIALARKEKAILLVAKLDRLSRKVSFIASLLDDKRLCFKVACMPNADKFQLHIYAALAEQERDFISIRTKAALKEARNRGVKLGGYRGSTQAMNDAAKAKADGEAEKLRGLIEPLFLAGESTRAIASKLNDAGIRTSRGATYQSMQISRLIKRLALKPCHDKALSPQT